MDLEGRSCPLFTTANKLKCNNLSIAKPSWMEKYKIISDTKKEIKDVIAKNLFVLSLKYILKSL